MMPSAEKIGPQHLARPAVVYVRQSTVSQVRHHHESQRRQYDLAARAKQLGWREVSVIDEDLGRSGASSAARPGFKHLVAEVGLAASARSSRSRSRASRATIATGISCSICAG